MKNNIFCYFFKNAFSCKTFDNRRKILLVSAMKMRKTTLTIGKAKKIQEAKNEKPSGMNGMDQKMKVPS